MKNPILALFLLSYFTSFGQTSTVQFFNFEDSVELGSLWIDTIANPNNIWQIGKPQKMIFDSSRSKPFAILTDTVKSYPINDTSCFLITHVVKPRWAGRYINLQLHFFASLKTDTDTLSDYGKIEFSFDDGESWRDVFSDSMWSDEKFVDKADETLALSGFSNVWVDLGLSVNLPNYDFGTRNFDSFLFKICFYSDSVQTFKEGMMFDDIIVYSSFLGNIDERTKFQSIIYPNPAIDVAVVKFKNERKYAYSCQLIDFKGKLILRDQTSDNNFQFDLSQYPSGLYHYRLVNEKTGEWSVGKIVKK